jgi:hypothetical protein
MRAFVALCDLEILGSPVTDTARIEDAHRCPACGAPPLHWEHDGPLTGTGEGGNLNIHPTGRPAARRMVSDWEPVPLQEESP